jgi:hypothetical protein
MLHQQHSLVSTSSAFFYHGIGTPGLPEDKLVIPLLPSHQPLQSALDALQTPGNDFVRVRLETAPLQQAGEEASPHGTKVFADAGLVVVDGADPDAVEDGAAEGGFGPRVHLLGEGVSSLAFQHGGEVIVAPGAVGCVEHVEKGVPVQCANDVICDGRAAVVEDLDAKRLDEAC